MFWEMLTAGLRSLFNCQLSVRSKERLVTLMRVLTCSISVGIHQFTSILDIWFMLCYKVTWTLTAGLGPVTLLEKRRGKKTKEKKRKAVSLKSRKNPTHAPKRACHARRHFASGQACDKIYNVSVFLQSWVQQCSKYVHAVQSMINLHTMMEEAGHAHAVCLVFMGSLQVCPISLDRTNTQTEKFGHFYDS